MKICLKCKKEKDYNSFVKDKNRSDGLNLYCKGCRKEQKKIYYMNNKKNILIKCKEYREKNKDLIQKKAKKYREENPERTKETKRKEYRNNISSYKEHSKRRQQIKKEEISLYQKEYRLKHKKERNRYYKQRAAVDPLYKLAINLRTRLGAALRHGYKTGSAIKDLGCSIEHLKDWLERQFEPGMSWDNYGNKAGQWSIDHEYPLSCVDLTKEQFVLPLIHYTNLQPMWHTKNMSKNNSLI